jgi:ribonuclease HI
MSGPNEAGRGAPAGPLKQVTLFSDGACLGNPGPGGYGIILVFGERRRELSGGFRRTTNNRMELMAAIKGLQALKERCAVRLVSDSEYLLNSISKGWALGWRSRGWKRAGKPVPNSDLWDQILGLIEFHRVSVQWIQGHAGHVENERCDLLARTAASGHDLSPDVGYEQIGAPPNSNPT